MEIRSHGNPQAESGFMGIVGDFHEKRSDLSGI
jgi:hypothetical protein